MENTSLKKTEGKQQSEPDPGHGSEQESEPDPEFVARQLRRPSGEFAGRVAEKMNRFNRFLFDLTLEAMEISDNHHILEIGFANGKFFNDVLTKASGLQVTGIDFSEDMVQEAKRNNADSIKSGKLNLYLGSSDHLPFDDESFDKVFCNNVIYFWDEPAEHVKEVHRVLKRGGAFYSGFRPGKSMRQFPFVKHGFNLYEVDEWIAILEESGFTVSGTDRKPEPPLEEGGEEIRLESVCVTAGK
ncbi:MAG: class I SAM-dependent methyltransferase [Balneolaceae bacterium]